MTEERLAPGLQQITSLAGPEHISIRAHKNGLGMHLIQPRDDPLGKWFQQVTVQRFDA
jgi:hypothetical protein